VLLIQALVFEVKSRDPVEGGDKSLEELDVGGHHIVVVPVAVVLIALGVALNLAT
jgi:hypothetical protein